MTIAHRIRQASENLEQSAREKEFITYARALLVSHGSPFKAFELLNQWGAPKLATIMKAAAQAGGFGSDAAWGSELAGYQQIAAGFIAALRNYGAFDAMLDAFVQVPIGTLTALTSTGITGSNPAEASPKPVSAAALSSIGVLQPMKAAAIIAITDALARSANAEAFLSQELKSAVAVTTDSVFLSITTAAGLASQASAGATLANITTDLAYLAANVSTSARSKLFLITTPALCKKLSFKSGTIGARAFAELGPLGGQIANIPVLISDAVTSGVVLLIDAQGFAAASEGVTLDASTQVDLQLDSAPDSPPIASAVMTSTWQRSLIALKAERVFSVKRLRASAVAEITGASY